jgi:hypothetical protein
MARNPKAILSLDSHQQQQIIAHALAAVASNSNANNLISAQINNNNSESMQGNLKTRSLADNMLNSKFLSHKNFSDKFAKKTPIAVLSTPCLLLSTVKTIPKT